MSQIVFLTIDGCTSDLNCQLNGECVNNTCQCYKPWIGSNCQFFDRLPIDENIQFYQNSNFNSSWGGNFIYDSKTNLYHLYASQIINHCGLQIWQHGSFCAHAVTSDPLQEAFKFSDVAIPVQCHNTQINRFSSKYNNQWLLIHEGHGNQSLVPTCCSSNSSIPYKDNYCNGTTPVNIENVSYVNAPLHPNGFEPINGLHTSNNPYGPWKAVDIKEFGGNPTLYIDNDDSIWFLFSNTKLYHAFINYPLFNNITNLTLINNDIQQYWNTSYYKNEDSFLWIDDNRHFHVLFHNGYPCNNNNNTYYNDGNPTKGGCGGHAFSLNGYDKWYFSDVAVYNSSITYKNGTTSNIGARERPKLVWDQNTKKPKYLVNGVSHHPCQGVDNGTGTCYSTSKPGNDHTFTIYQELNI